MAPLRRSPRRSGAATSSATAPAPPDPRRHLPAEHRAHRRRREISAPGERRRFDVDRGRGRRCSAPVTLLVRDVRDTNPSPGVATRSRGFDTLWERFLLRLAYSLAHADLPYRCSPVTLAPASQQQRIAAATRARARRRPITFRDLLDRLWRTRACNCQDRPDARRRFGHPQDMEAGGPPDCGVCAAVDVHYLSTGARAAAVLGRL